MDERREKIEKVRCQNCGRLLGVMEDGLVISRHHRREFWSIRPVVIICERCGTKTIVK